MGLERTTAMEVERPEGSVAGLLAAAGWLRVEEDIMSGVRHDLNGRVSALDGLLQIVEMDGAERTPVREYLQAEVERLWETVRVLSYLAGDLEGPVEPHLAADVVARVVALHRRHRDLDKVATEAVVADGLPPFRAPLPFLLRALLIILSEAGRQALGAGVARVVLEVRREGGELLFEVRWGDDGGAGWETSAFTATAALLAEALAGAGGSATATARGTVLALPAMKGG